MRRTLQAVTVAIASSVLVACAALTGLDGITEDDCAPHGCADGAVAADTSVSERAVTAASPESGVDAGIDAAEADPEAWSDASDASPDAGVDVHDAAADTSFHAGDAAPDAPPDTLPADASTDSRPPGDAAPDSPCGTVYLHESFEAPDGGWSLDPTWSIARTCAAPPAPQKGYADPTVDHTTSAAGGVAGVYACGNNPTGTTSPSRYATSPAVDVSAAPSVKLQFYRWLNSDADGWMTSTVDVFDGSAWVNVYTNPSGAGNVVADGAWTKIEYDVTAHKSAAFRVRFGYAVTDAGVYAMSCWNVDDVTVSSSSCP